MYKDKSEHRKWLIRDIKKIRKIIQKEQAEYHEYNNWAKPDTR